MRIRTAMVMATVVLGCGPAPGASLGEKSPGRDTYLGFGDIGVDDRTETSFVLTGRGGDGGYPTSLTLTAVRAGATTSEPVEDLSKRTDLRILFPESGILVMSESDKTDRLDLFDKESLRKISSSSAAVRYNGTRMSASRRWVAVTDNTSQYAPIHVIDARTLQTHEIPHGGDWLEAMWLNQTDELVAIVFYFREGTAPHARVMSWRMQQVEQNGFEPDSSGFWPAPRLDIDVPGALPDRYFSFTWVGISPTDTQAVLPVVLDPVINDGTGSPAPGSSPDGGPPLATIHTLLVVDLGTGELRMVPYASGPVGFTPDGKTIVSYKGSSLKLINAETLEVETKDLPIEGGLTYFVSHDGNFVVAGSTAGNERMVLVDIDHDTITQMSAPGVRLNEFVARPGRNELWVVDHRELYRMDLSMGAIEPVAIDFHPQALNVLPRANRLVFDGEPRNELVFFDPDARQIATRVRLDGDTF